MTGNVDSRVPRPRPLPLLLSMAIALTTAAAFAAAEPLPALVQGSAVPSPGWRVQGWPAQEMPLTDYTAEQVDGRQALRMQARASYGNLVHERPAQAPPRSITWAWRMQQPNAKADLRTRAGDDAAAKVCMSFDLPLQQVPVVERALLRLARSRSGQALPGATLCWVWAGGEAPGSVVVNAYTRRVRYMVLRTAADPTGQWLTEARDVAADFQRAFGDESAATPPLTAVIVAADADNTGATTVAHITDLRFVP